MIGIVLGDDQCASVASHSVCSGWLTACNLNPSTLVKEYSQVFCGFLLVSVKGLHLAAVQMYVYMFVYVLKPCAHLFLC